MSLSPTIVTAPRSAGPVATAHDGVETLCPTSARTLNVVCVASTMPSLGHPECGIFVYRRIQALAALCNVEVIRPVPSFPVYRPWTDQRRSARLDGQRFTVHDSPMFYLPLVLKHWDSLWLRRAIKQVVSARHTSAPIDVLDAHFGFPDGVAAYRIGRELGIPVFITLRGVEQEEIEVPGIRRQLVDALTNCAGVIAVSDKLKDMAVSAGVPERQIRVIPNAVDSDLFQPGNREHARRHLGIKDSTRLIVSVGNLKRVKGHDVLIRAFAEFRSRFPDARLAIIGSETLDRQHVTELRDLIRELKLDPHVVFTGSLPPEQVVTWLQAADLFSLASHREGCCNAVLEALACGLPVVATDVGANRHFVQDSGSGTVVPVQNPRMLAESILQALQRTFDKDKIRGNVVRNGWDDVARQTRDYFFSRIPA